MQNIGTALAVAAFLLIMGVSYAGAQFTRIPIVKVEKKPRTAPSGGPPRAKRAVSVRKVETKVITKTQNVRSSSLAITTEPGAKVVLEKTGPQPLKLEKIADVAGSVIFEDMKPGIYDAQASKENFESAEADKVTIAARTAHVLDMDLKPVTYKLKIQTNVTDGDILFAQAEITGKDPSGAIASRRLGNYCVVEIGPKGEAEVSELRKGYYEIDIRPPLAFEQKLTGINIPDDLDDDVGGGLRTFEIDLENQLSTETFNPTAWVPADWSMPASWKLDNGIKVRNTDGIALPQNERYRYYRHFEMIADAKVPDDGVIGFVLRAENDKNFYLLQISGRRASQPKAATLFSMKDGVMTAIQTQTTDAFEKTIASNSGFRVYILNEKDEEFIVRIRDSETGQVFPLAGFSDPLPTHPKGAPGLAAMPRSSFEVSNFMVCTPRCSR